MSHAKRAPSPRDAILRRFEEWLDEVLAGEEPPPGISRDLLAELAAEEDPLDFGAHDEETEVDRYVLWRAVTALTHEVKLQGRSFSRLRETLAPLAEAAARRVEPLAESGSELHPAPGAGPAADPGADLASELYASPSGPPEPEPGAEHLARREMLQVLVELRDRLGRGLEAAEERIGDGPDAVAAMARGYALSLEHLDEVLERYGVREIGGEGEAFDPRAMTAASVEETDRVPDGTVLQVLRAGYTWKDSVLRAAQVRVSRCGRRQG